MIFSECEVPSPMFPASVSTAHRWLSRLLCFSAHLVFLVPLVGVALCLELKVSLPNAEDKKNEMQPRRSKPGNEVENCNSKMFALGYEKNERNGQQQKWSAVHWSGQSCGIYSNPNTCGMGPRNRALPAWIRCNVFCGVCRLMRGRLARRFINSLDGCLIFLPLRDTLFQWAMMIAEIVLTHLIKVGISLILFVNQTFWDFIQ